MSAFSTVDILSGPRHARPIIQSRRHSGGAGRRCGADTTAICQTIEADEATTLAKQGKLFDARPRSSYIGDPAKAGTGHIPGAIRAAAGDSIADNKFKSTDDLRARFCFARRGCLRQDRRLLRQRQFRRACRCRDDSGWSQACALRRFLVSMERRIHRDPWQTGPQRG